MADLSTNEIQEITLESNTIQGSEEKQSAKLKKKVAMWVGYVGTHYKGLQMQRGPNSGQQLRMSWSKQYTKQEAS